MQESWRERGFIDNQEVTEGRGRDSVDFGVIGCLTCNWGVALWSHLWETPFVPPPPLKAMNGGGGGTFLKRVGGAGGLIQILYG